MPTSQFNGLLLEVHYSFCTGDYAFIGRTRKMLRKSIMSRKQSADFLFKQHLLNT